MPTPLCAGGMALGFGPLPLFISVHTKPGCSAIAMVPRRRHTGSSSRKRELAAAFERPYGHDWFQWWPHAARFWHRSPQRSRALAAFFWVPTSLVTIASLRTVTLLEKSACSTTYGDSCRARGSQVGGGES
eukprot:3939303-Prymnesium_polylepis.2